MAQAMTGMVQLPLRLITPAMFMSQERAAVQALFHYATIKYSSTGIEENKPTVKKGKEITTTIFSGPLLLPNDKNCKVFDITGRVVAPDKLRPGIYFIEVDEQITRKIIKTK